MLARTMLAEAWVKGLGITSRPITRTTSSRTPSTAPNRSAPRDLLRRARLLPEAPRTRTDTGPLEAERRAFSCPPDHVAPPPAKVPLDARGSDLPPPLPHPATLAVAASPDRAWPR